MNQLKNKNHLNDLHLYIERFGLEFTNKNDIAFKGFSSEAIGEMKKYNWPGNIRELKNVVESLLVINKGERITDAMVRKALNIDNSEENRDLPITLGENSDKLERELILKQLLYLRQDINELKTIIFQDKSGDVEPTKPSNPALFLPNNQDVSLSSGHKNIEDAGISGLKDEAVGEMTMNELEKEVIEKYLKRFKNNRRKTANALSISERTLYRKLKEYEIK